MQKIITAVLAAALIGGAAYHFAVMHHNFVIADQGSFMAGGTGLHHTGKYTSPYSPDGQTFHGDHAYVFWQKPFKARKYPLVFVHGIEQFSKTFETTPDGREGFQNIFLKKRFAVYLVDQARRGRAGRSTKKATVEPVFDEQLWFDRFRIGTYPNYFDGVQFKRGKETLDQFFRQMTPTIGRQDFDVYADAYAAVLEKTGDAILVTHSQGGAVGWLTARKTDKIKAIVSYEPGGSFPFVKDENPTAMKAESGQGETVEVSEDEMQKYTRFPIIIYYGDNMPADETATQEQQRWRNRLEIARKWAEAVNKRGGDATVVHLPDVGLHGNTHFPFSDLNNLDVAKLMSDWLHEKELD